MNRAKAPTYKELQSDLQRILAALEQDSTSLDDMAALLKSGFETVDALRARLSESEAQIENIISLRHNNHSSGQLAKDEGDSK